MSDAAPERIWAWKMNLPTSKFHGANGWSDRDVWFKKVKIPDFSGTNWINWLWCFRTHSIEQIVTEYVRADLCDPKAIREDALREIADEMRRHELYVVAGIILKLIPQEPKP